MLVSCSKEQHRAGGILHNDWFVRGIETSLVAECCQKCHEVPTNGLSKTQNRMFLSKTPLAMVLRNTVLSASESLHLLRRPALALCCVKWACPTGAWADLSVRERMRLPQQASTRLLTLATSPWLHTYNSRLQVLLVGWRGTVWLECCYCLPNGVMFNSDSSSLIR